MSGATTQTLGSVQYPVIAQNAQAPVIPGGSTLRAVQATAPDAGTVTAVIAADVALACTLTAGTSSSPTETGAGIVLTVECNKGDSVVLSLLANAGPSRRLSASVVFTPTTVIPGDLSVLGLLTAAGQGVVQAFDVRNFGASVAAADNTAQVQAALSAAAAANGTLFVPGVFTCTGQLTVPAGQAVRLLGLGRAGSQLLYTGALAQPFLIFPGLNQGSSIENLSVWGGNATPAVQILSAAGSGTNGYQSLITLRDAYIGFVYNGAAGNLSNIGLQVQCDVFRMVGVDVWGSNIAAWYQQGTTDAYITGSSSSCLPQGRAGDTVKIGTLLEDGSAGVLFFGGTFLASNCAFAGVVGSTANIATHSVASLVNCYSENGTLPIRAAGDLSVIGGDWSTVAADALYILNCVGCSSVNFAPANVAGNAHLTNLVHSTSTVAGGKINVRLQPLAAIPGTVPAAALNLDAPGEVVFPGYDIGYPSFLVHITHAQNGYAARPGDVVLVDATAGVTFVQLPPPVANTAPITVKKIDASANGVEINHNSTETIDGAANIIWTTQYEAATVASDGTNWFVINQVATTIL